MRCFQNLGLFDKIMKNATLVWSCEWITVTETFKLHKLLGNLNKSERLRQCNIKSKKQPQPNEGLGLLSKCCNLDDLYWIYCVLRNIYKRKISLLLAWNDLRFQFVFYAFLSQNYKVIISEKRFMFTDEIAKNLYNV